MILATVRNGDCRGKLTLSEQMFSYCSPTCKTQTVVENDPCEQKVNKHLLTEFMAYLVSKH